MKCRIVVLKKMYNQDLVDKYYLQKDYPACEFFEVGQEFIYDKCDIYSRPDNFCGWAWDDIRNTLIKVMDWKKEKSVVACCSDGIRPVVFSIERIE